MLVTIQMGSHIFAQGELVAVTGVDTVEIRDGNRRFRGKTLRPFVSTGSEPRAGVSEAREPAHGTARV